MPLMGSLTAATPALSWIAVWEWECALGLLTQVSGGETNTPIEGHPLSVREHNDMADWASVYALYSTYACSVRACRRGGMLGSTEWERRTLDLPERGDQTVAG